MVAVAAMVVVAVRQTAQHLLGAALVVAKKGRQATNRKAINMAKVSVAKIERPNPRPMFRRKLQQNHLATLLPSLAMLVPSQKSVLQAREVIMPLVGKEVVNHLENRRLKAVN
jgi:hypothetical protein